MAIKLKKIIKKSLRIFFLIKLGSYRYDYIDINFQYDCYHLKNPSLKLLTEFTPCGVNCIFSYNIRKSM